MSQSLHDAAFELDSATVGIVKVLEGLFESGKLDKAGRTAGARCGCIRLCATGLTNAAARTSASLVRLRKSWRW